MNPCSFNWVTHHPNYEHHTEILLYTRGRVVLKTSPEDDPPWGEGNMIERSCTNRF